MSDTAGVWLAEGVPARPIWDEGPLEVKIVGRRPVASQLSVRLASGDGWEDGNLRGHGSPFVC